MQPVMITAAMVGAEVTRAAQPNLPTTPQEIVAAAVECYEAGASIIHIHVRDADGNATQDGNLFRQVVEGIRARCDVITQVSTGGAIWMSAEERLQSIECRPGLEPRNLLRGHAVIRLNHDIWSIHFVDNDLDRLARRQIF